jgi:lipoyl synthase
VSSPSPLPLRKPAWLKARIPGGRGYSELRSTVDTHHLHTVCESAGCPNMGECWSGGTATFMILGNTCTRGCRFCEVPKGRPGDYDRDEPDRVAASVKLMRLKYAVITSVTRDDIPDQGSEVWADTIATIKAVTPECKVETLIPDMQGRMDLLDTILNAGPDVLNHNFETVRRLQKQVRGRGNIADSSAVLKHSKSRGFLTKTSLMLGLGEEANEIRDMLDYCAELKVDIVTLGQYLAPSKNHHPILRYVTPEEFDEHRAYALALGIPVCVSGPLVRSSYNADKAAEPLFSPKA